MKENSYKRKTCRLCLSKNLVSVLELTPIPLPDEYIPKSKLSIKQPIYPLTLVLCRNCGNVQLSHVVNPKIIYKNYIYETVSSLGLVEHFQKYADDVIGRTKTSKGSLVIDIGSNDGTLLRAFKSLGMKVLGIDPAKDIAKTATSSGIETIPDYFTLEVAKQIVKKYGKAHIVTLNNIFANIDEVNDFMNGIKILMASDGVLVIESYYLPDLINNMVFDFIYHEHLTSFTAGTLQKFFKRHGMELYDAVHIPTKGGSLRYFIQMKDGGRKSTRELQGFINKEQKMGMHKISLYKRFGMKIEQEKNRTLKAIGKYENKGRTIAGYGASATSTTLIYHFLLGNKLNYLVDEYARKQHTFSPGLHIPVHATDILMKDNPVAVVILAWRYADVIIKKNKAFLDHGGTFIIPLPKLRIVTKSS